jgi:hypothetical protein
MAESKNIRIALVENAQDAKQLWAYLPENYAIVSWVGSSGSSQFAKDGKSVYMIAGFDSHGWTLHDYVIPRLGSGLIWAREITEQVDEVVDFLREARS